MRSPWRNVVQLGETRPAAAAPLGLLAMLRLL